MNLIGHFTKGMSLLILILFINYSFGAESLQKYEPGIKLKVFILAGQSNMEGRADAAKLISDDLKRLSNVKDKVLLAFNNEAVGPLRPVKAPVEIAEIYNLDSIFGPELFFGITLAEAWPAEDILLIKLSEGGSSLQGCWNSEWSKDKAKIMGEEQDPKLYSALIDYVRKTLSDYNENEYEICGMLWVQGETDSGNKIASENYKENLEEFIVHIRHDFKDDLLPFILFQVGNGKVVEGMKIVANLMPNVTLISQSPKPTSVNFYPKLENGHYNYEGMKKLGTRFAEVYLNQIGHNK